MANTSLTMEKFLEDTGNVTFLTSVLKEPDAVKKFKEGSVTPDEAQTYFSKIVASMKAKPTAFQRQGSQFLDLYPNPSVDLGDEDQRNDFIKFLNDKFVETLSAISNYSKAHDIKIDITQKYVKNKKDSKKPEGGDEAQPIESELQKLEGIEVTQAKEREAAIEEFRSFLDTLSKNTETCFVDVSREVSSYETMVFNKIDTFKSTYPVTVNKIEAQARAEAIKKFVAEMSQTETSFLTELVTELKKKLFENVEMAGALIDFKTWAAQNPKELDKIRGLVYSNAYHTLYQNIMDTVEETSNFLAAFNKHHAPIESSKELLKINALSNSMRRVAEGVNKEHHLGKEVSLSTLKSASMPFVKIAGGGHTDFEGVAEDPDYAERTFDNFRSKYPNPNEALIKKIEDMEIQLAAFQSFKPSESDVLANTHINPLFTLATGDQDKAFKSYKALYSMPVAKLVDAIKKTVKEKIPAVNLEAMNKQARECGETVSRMLVNVREGIAKIKKYLDITVADIKDPSIMKAQRALRNVVKRNPNVSIEADSFRSDMDGLNSIHVESAAHKIERFKEQNKEAAPLPGTGAISGMVRAAMVKAFSIREYTNSGAFHDISPESDIMPAIQGFDTSIMRMHDWIERTLKKNESGDGHTTALDTANKEWEAFKAGADGKQGAAVLVDQLKTAQKAIKDISKNGFSALHASILKSQNNPYSSKRQDAAEALLKHEFSANPSKDLIDVLGSVPEERLPGAEVAIRLVNEYSGKATAAKEAELRKQIDSIAVDEPIKTDLLNKLNALVDFETERVKLTSSRDEHASKEQHTNHVFDSALGRFGILGNLMDIDYDTHTVSGEDHVPNPQFLQYRTRAKDFFNTLKKDLADSSKTGELLKFFKEHDPDEVAFAANKDVAVSVAQDAVDIFDKLDAQLQLVGKLTAELIEGTQKVSKHIPFYDIEVPENNPLTYYKLLKQDHDYGNIIDNNYGLHGSLKHSVEAMHKTAASVVATLDKLAEALHLGEEVNVDELKALTESPVHIAISDYERAVGEVGRIDSLNAYDALISHINSRTDEMEISKYIDQAVKYFKRIKPLKKLQNAPELIRASVVDAIQKEVSKLAGSETKKVKKASVSSEMVKAVSLLSSGELWKGSALIRKIAGRSLNIYRNNDSLFAPSGSESKEEARKNAEASLKDIGVWSSNLSKALTVLAEAVGNASDMLSGAISVGKSRNGATLDFSSLSALLKAIDNAATASSNTYFLDILKKYFPHMISNNSSTFVQSLRRAGDEIEKVISNYHEASEDFTAETIETLQPEMLLKNSTSIEDALVHIHDAATSINKAFSLISSKMLAEIKGKETGENKALNRAKDLLAQAVEYNPGVDKDKITKDIRDYSADKVALTSYEWAALVGYLNTLSEGLNKESATPEGLLSIEDFKKAGSMPLSYNKDGSPILEAYSYKDKESGKEISGTKKVYDTSTYVISVDAVKGLKKTLAFLSKNQEDMETSSHADLPVLRKDLISLTSSHKKVQQATDAISNTVTTLAKNGVMGVENKARLVEKEDVQELHNKLNDVFDKLPYAMKEAENAGAASVIHKQTLKLMRSGNTKSAVNAPEKPITDADKRNALVKHFGKEQLEAANWLQKTFIDKSRPSSNLLKDVYNEYLVLAGKKNLEDQEKIRLNQGIIPILKSWPDKTVRSLFSHSLELMSGDASSLSAAAAIRDSISDYADGYSESPISALHKTATTLHKDSKNAPVYDILKDALENAKGSDLHERIATIRSVVRNNDPHSTLNDRTQIDKEIEGISKNIDDMHPSKFTGVDGISFPGIYQMAKAVATKISGKSKLTLSKAVNEELEKYVAPANEQKPTADEVLVALKDMLTHGGYMQHNLGASTISNRKDSEEANLSHVSAAGTSFERKHPGIGSGLKDSIKEALDLTEKEMLHSKGAISKDNEAHLLSDATYEDQVKNLENQFKEAHSKLSQLNKELAPLLSKEGTLTESEKSAKDSIQGKIDLVRETIEDIARKETEALNKHVAAKTPFDAKHPVQAEKYLKDYMGTRLEKVRTLSKELSDASKVPAKEMYSGVEESAAEEKKKEYLEFLTSRIDKERRDLDYAQGDLAGGVPGNPGDMALAAHKHHMDEAKKLHAKVRAHTTYRVQKALGNTDNANRIAQAHGFDENTNIRDVSDKMGDHLMRANIIGSHYHNIDTRHNLSSDMDESSRSKGQRPKLFKHEPMSAVTMDEAFQELSDKRESSGGFNRPRKNAPTEGTYQGSHLTPSRQEVLGTQTGDDVAARFVREEASLFLQKWNHIVKAGGMSHKGLTPEAIKNIIGDVFEQSKKRISGEYSREMLEGFTSPDGTRYKGKIEELKTLRSEWEYSLSALQEQGENLSTAIQTLMEELAVVVKGTKDTHDNVKELIDNHAKALVDSKVKQESDNQSVKYLGADDEDSSYILKGDEDGTLATMSKNLSGHLKSRNSLSRMLKGGGQKAEKFLNDLSEKLEEVRSGSAVDISFSNEEKALLGPRTVDAITHAVNSGDPALMARTASKVRSDFPNLGGAKKLADKIEEKLDVLVGLHGKPTNDVIKTVSDEGISFSEEEYEFMGEKLASQTKQFLETAGKSRITANFDNILSGRVKAANKTNIIKLIDMTPEERDLQKKVSSVLNNYNDLLTVYELDLKNLQAEFGGDLEDPEYKEEEAKLQKRYLAEKTSLRTRLQVSTSRISRSGASDIVHKATKTLMAGLDSRMPVAEETKLIQEIQSMLGVHMSVHSPYEEGSSHRVQKLEHHLEELDKHNAALPSNDPTARMEYQKTRQKLLKNIRNAVKDLKNDTSGEARSAYKVAIHSLQDMPKSSIKDILLKGAEVIDKRDMDSLLENDSLMKAVNKLTDLGSSYLEEIPAKVTGMIDNFMGDLEKVTDKLKNKDGKAYTSADKAKFVELMDKAKNKIVAHMPTLMSPHAKIAFQKASSVASSPAIRKDMLLKAVDTGSMPSDMIIADIDRLLRSGSLTKSEADSLKDSSGLARLKNKEGTGRLDATSKMLRKTVEQVKNKIVSFESKKVSAEKIINSNEVDEFLKRLHEGAFENSSEESQKEIASISESLDTIHDQALIDSGNSIFEDFQKQATQDGASGLDLVFSKPFYRETKSQIEHFLDHNHAESDSMSEEVGEVRHKLSQVLSMIEEEYPAIADHVFTKLSNALAAYNSAYVTYTSEASKLLEAKVPSGADAVKDTTMSKSQEITDRYVRAYNELAPLMKSAEYYTKYTTKGLTPEARKIAGIEDKGASSFDQMEKAREYVASSRANYSSVANNLYVALDSFSKKWSKELARHYKKNPGIKTAAMVILAEGSDDSFRPMSTQEKAEQRTTSYPGAPTNESTSDEPYEEKAPKRIDNSDLGYQQDYFGEIHKNVMNNLDRLNKKMGMRLTSDTQPKRTDIPKEYSEKSLDLLGKALSELQNTSAITSDHDSYEKNVKKLLKAWRAEQAKGEGPLVDPEYKGMSPEEVAAMFLGKSNSLIGHLQHIQGIHDLADERFGRGQNFDMASAAYVAAKQHRANAGEDIGPKQDKLIKSVENRWHAMGDKIKRNLAAIEGHMDATKKALDKAGTPEEMKALRSKLYTLDAAHKQRLSVANKHAEITESGADYVEDLGSTHTLAKNLYLAGMDVRNQMRKVVEILSKPGTGFEGGLFKVKDAMKNLASWANIQRREQVSIRNSMEHARKMIDKIDDQITDYQIYLKNAKENNGVGLSKLEQDNFARQFVSRIYEWILYLWNRNPEAFEYYFGGSLKNYDEFFEQHKQEIGVLNNKRISKSIMFVTNLIDDMRLSKRKLEGYELTKLHHLLDIRDSLFRSKYTLSSIGIFKHGVYEFLKKLDIPPDVAKKKEQELSNVTSKVSEEDLTLSAQLIQGTEDLKKELLSSGKMSGIDLVKYEDPNFKPHGSAVPPPTSSEPKVAKTTEDVVRKYAHRTAGAVTVDAVTRLVAAFQEK